MLCENLSVIILAAGQGKRMLSNIPKVMHKIGGKSMLQHLVDTVLKMGVRSVYIVCSNDNYCLIAKTIDIGSYKIPIHWILQHKLLGTGHAARKALSVMHDEEEVCILYGDVPLISCKTLMNVCSIKSQCDIGLLTAILDNPIGYGRIIRDRQSNIVNIVEHDDIISDNYRKIKEINSGVLVSTVRNLKSWVKKLSIHSIKGEFYLTDIVNIAHHSGCTVQAVQPVFGTFEVMGVNSISDLVYLNRKYQKKQAKRLLSMGILVVDPSRLDLRGTLVCGRDVYIDINVIIEGYVSLGNRVKIGASCILKDTVIGDDVIIYPFSSIENATINGQSVVGPFARLRAGIELKEKSYVGNFVELKNVRLGNASKVKHLSYLGDAEIGSQVNIGAGTIICNFNGLKKNYTSIGDNVFIGSDSQLVAPLTIGKNATIGAGTTVTQDVADYDTVISRIHQFSIANTKSLKK